jgi:ERF superfamily
MQKSESIVKLTMALVKAKQKFAPLLRNQENPGFKRDGKASKYADLAAVIEATEGPLLENGLVLTQFPHNDGERVGVQNMLVHESGEFLEHTFTVAIIKQDAQTSVAGITYARRVSMKSILGISDEDDDGNKASEIPTTGMRNSTPIPRPQSDAPVQTPKPAPVQAPKAEIPKDMLGTKEQAVAASAAIVEEALKPASTEMPTEEQLVEFRKQFKQLGDDLATAGLKAGRGLPINRKVLAFLLKTTGATEAGAVNLAQWTQFFHKVELTKQGEGGIKTLVARVNEANGITEEKKLN